jgi:class 3 adenylate cyclase
MPGRRPSLRLTAEPFTAAPCRINVGYADLQANLRPRPHHRRLGRPVADGDRHVRYDRHRGLDAAASDAGRSVPAAACRPLPPAARSVGSTGVEVRSEGDALFYVFVDAPSAVRAALDGQRRLAEHQWPADAAVGVRMGIHSGEGRLLDGDYVGLDVHRTARITDAGHGGQVVLSDAAHALAAAALPPEAELRDLGEHRLKDLERPERVFQLVAPGMPADFPPLRSLEKRQHDLPAQVTSFVGRQRERDQLVELLGSCRLVTLTGPGGTGKTRLAIEVADGCIDAFADGVHFVPLATISDADLVLPTVAARLGLREALRARFAKC